MKKKLLFILPLATLCVVGVGATSSAYQVVAEEVVVEEQPITNEEENTSVIDWEAIEQQLDEAQAKLNKVKEYQVFGTTIGAIIGGLISLLLSAVFKKIGQQNIENACKIAEESKAKLEQSQVDIKETFNNAQIIIGELKKQVQDNERITTILNDTSSVIDELKKKNELAEKELQQLKEILLKIAYSNKDLIKSGVAKELHENFDNE